MNNSHELTVREKKMLLLHSIHQDLVDLTVALQVYESYQEPSERSLLRRVVKLHNRVNREACSIGLGAVVPFGLLE